jgi:CheY-like chemotaxis protein
MQGIDLMSDCLAEFETKLTPSLLKSDGYFNFLHEMKGNMTSIRNTNAFMLMCINRTMDFTKVSRGLKLIPTMDSINLLQTLYLPLNCMKNIQNRVSIHLLPISAKICSFIVTDRQWLQENILCLLSNAAKYSSGGDVTVKISLRKNSRPADPLALSQNNSVHTRNSDDNHYLSSVRSTTGNNSVHSTTLGATINLPVLGKKGFLFCEVEDNGIGMTEEMMQSLFSPFKQAQRLAGGTGLGLYSLSKRIEALGGEYGVTGRKDGKQGCLFWFSVPYLPDYTMNQHSCNENTLHYHHRPRLQDIGTPRSQNNNNEEKSPRAASPRGKSPQTTLRISRRSRSFSNDSHSIGLVSTTSDPPFIVGGETSHLHHQQSLQPQHPIRSYIPAHPPQRKKSTTSLGKHLLAYTSLSILLVEDSPTISKMTAMMLQKLGHSVTIAENGHIGLNLMTQALDRLTSSSHSLNPLNPTASFRSYFDVILMDFQMPVMDGLEATRRYREYEKHRNPGFHQLILGLSATFDKEIIQEALNLGLDDYLMKPITKDLFLSKMEKFLSVGVTVPTSVTEDLPTTLVAPLFV